MRARSKGRSWPGSDAERQGEELLGRRRRPPGRRALPARRRQPLGRGVCRRHRRTVPARSASARRCRGDRFGRRCPTGRRRPTGSAWVGSSARSGAAPPRVPRSARRERPAPTAGCPASDTPRIPAGSPAVTRSSSASNPSYARVAAQRGDQGQLGQRHRGQADVARCCGPAPPPRWHGPPRRSSSRPRGRPAPTAATRTARGRSPRRCGPGSACG